MTGLTRQPRFIVFRAAPGVPPGFMPRGMEGRWEYRPEKHESLLVSADNFTAVALPAGRVEHRESDGASAEVWEVHPRGGQYDPADWRLPE